MLHARSSATVSEIGDRGYAIEPFLDAADIQTLLTLHRETSPAIPSDYYVTAFGEDLATKRRIYDGITEVVVEKTRRLAPGYRILMASFVNKKARSTRGRLGLHQDYSLVDHAEHLGLNVWCPLCDVDERNGCLKVVNGSHLLGHISATPPNPAPFDDVRAELDSDRYMVELPMSAGAAFLFDQRVLHATEDNRTDSDRTSVFLNLIPENVTPRLYIWNKQNPGQLEIYAVDTDVMLRLPPNKYVEDASRLGAKSLGFIDYTFERLTSADLRKRVSVVQPKETPALVPGEER